MNEILKTSTDVILYLKVKFNYLNIISMRKDSTIKSESNQGKCEVDQL